MTNDHKTIRDPVHGDVALSREELSVLDSPSMQRLRGIRQLGTAHYVYPGAHHTRFEHSLGTCWMAKKVVAALERSGEAALDAVEQQAVFLTALIHDITHVPFGHTFEDERKILLRHDMDLQRYNHFLVNGRLGERLQGSEAGRLALGMLNPGAQASDAKPYLMEIVDGMISADLLDYLKRDNYFCGLSQLYDDRLFHYFGIHNEHLALRLHRGGMFRRDALSEITHLLRIRYVLSERVYYHHAKTAAGVMISKALERALRGGMQAHELYPLTDEAFPWYLRQHYGQDACLVEILDLLARRRLFKRCYMLSREIGEEAVAAFDGRFHRNSRGEREELEAAIAAQTGLRPHEIAVYCPASTMALKEAAMPSVVQTGRILRFCDLNTDEVLVLQKQHRLLWKFFVFVSPERSAQKDAVSGACEEILGFKNEWRV